MTQQASKIPRRSPSTFPRGPQEANKQCFSFGFGQIWAFQPFRFPGAPKRLKRPPGSPQEGPRGPQEGSKTAPDGCKTAQEASKTAQEGPKNAARTPQEGVHETEFRALGP
eukprot:6197017-Pyramimonas_sp.AAC.1